MHPLLECEGDPPAEGFSPLYSDLGYLLTLGRSTYRIDIILLALSIYGLLGFTADAIVRLLERTLLAWRHGFTGA